MATASDKTTNLPRPATIQEKGGTKYNVLLNLTVARIAISTVGRIYPNTQYGLRKREQALPANTPNKAIRTTPVVSSHGFISTLSILL